MTDKEIIKALECCGACYCHECYDCDYSTDDGCLAMLQAKDLINRQQAEIERLKEEHDKNFEKWEILDKRTKERYAELYEEAKGVVRAKAIEEFAERLKERIADIGNLSVSEYLSVATDIDDIEREMVGADNG